MSPKLDWMKVSVFCIGMCVTGTLILFNKIPSSTLGIFVGWLLPSPVPKQKPVEAP